MATNRFFKPGQSTYQKQYVPTKIPFQLMQQNLARKDAKMDADMQEYNALNNDIAIEGIDQTKLDSYASSIGGVGFQGGGNIILGDRSKSQKSANNITKYIDELSGDDLILASTTNDFADRIIKGKQMLSKHKADNNIYKQRADAIADIEKTIRDEKDNWNADYTLIFGLEEELKQAKKFENYIPTNVGVGKYFNSQDYMLNKANMLKDISNKSLSEDGNFNTWASSTGVKADRYAQFVRTLMEDENGPLRQEANRKINALIKHGDIENTEEAINATYNEIVKQHINSAKELEHMSYDKGKTYKSQGQIDDELAEDFDSGGVGPEVITLNDDSTTANDVDNNVNLINRKIKDATRLVTEFETAMANGEVPKIDVSTYNAKKKSLETLNKQKTDWEYNQARANEIINSKGYTDANNALRPQEAKQLAIDNPQLFSILFTKNTTNPGTSNEKVTYEFNNNLPPEEFKKYAITQIIKQHNISKEDAVKYVNTDPTFNQLINDASNYSDKEIKDVLKAGEANNVLKDFTNKGLVLKNDVGVTGTGGKQYLTSKQGISGEKGVYSIDYPAMYDYLKTTGKITTDYDPKDNNKILDLFDATLVKETNNKKILKEKRDKIESDREALKAAPIGGDSNNNYSTPPVISLGHIPKEMINSTYNNIGLTGTEISVNGKVIEDNNLKQLIINQVLEEGDNNRAGMVTGKGGIIIKGVSEVPVKSKDELHLLYAQETGNKWNETRDVYDEWAKDYETVMNNASAVQVKMVPTMGGENNIKYAQTRYSKKVNEIDWGVPGADDKLKNINSTMSSTNLTTHNAVNGVGNEEGITQLNKKAFVKGGFVVPLNKNIELITYNKEGIRTVTYVPVESSRMVSKGGDGVEPTFEYIFKWNGERSVIPVTGPDGNNLIEELINYKYDEDNQISE